MFEVDRRSYYNVWHFLLLFQEGLGFRVEVSWNHVLMLILVCYKVHIRGLGLIVEQHFWFCFWFVLKGGDRPHINLTGKNIRLLVLVEISRLTHCAFASGHKGASIGTIPDPNFSF